MMPPKDRMCHRCSFDKSCRDLVNSEACGRWSNLKGLDPQTGDRLDRWGCVDDQIPILLMSIGKMSMDNAKETAELRKLIERRARPQPPPSVSDHQPQQITGES